MGYRIDERLWPRCVLLDLFGGGQIGAEMDSFFRWHRQLYAMNQRFCLLTVIRRDTRAGAGARAEMGKRFAALKDQAARLMIANAVVPESMLVRGIFTATTWISPAPHPQRIFDSVLPCVPWLNEHLQREGLPQLEAGAMRHISSWFDESAQRAS